LARPVAWGAAVVLVAAACSSGGGGGSASDWVTWGHGVERQGFNPDESTIGVSNVDQLKQRWSVDLGGNVDTAAVVAAGVRVAGRSRDLAYVGTEHGTFYAIDVADGRIVWKKQFPTQTLECAESADNIFGITAAAAIDRSEKRVYVAAADGKLHGLDLATGAEVKGWPVTLTEPGHDFVLGALTPWKGVIYVATASHCEIGPYDGRIFSIDKATAAKRHVFWITGEGPPPGGSVWGWGGVSVDSRTGDVFAATGNAASFPESAGYGDQIVRLTGDLKLVAANAPPIVGFDDDFGSTPVLFQHKGCPPQLAAMRKHGALYLYDRDAITEGPRQTVNVSGTPYRFIGLPAFWPEDDILFVANPTSPPDENYTHGMLAFKVADNCRLKLAWQTTAGRNDSVTSTPTIANGVVYYGDGMGAQIHAFNARTGKTLWSSAPRDIGGPVFVAPVVVNGTVLAGAWDGRLHAWRR
jgi:outer membrane protein assembly factor BamB